MTGLRHAPVCRPALARRAGIHFYTLNRSPATRAILAALRGARPSGTGPWRRSADGARPPIKFAIFVGPAARHLPGDPGDDACRELGGSRVGVGIQDQPLPYTPPRHLAAEWTCSRAAAMHFLPRCGEPAAASSGADGQAGRLARCDERRPLRAGARRRRLLGGHRRHGRFAPTAISYNNLAGIYRTLGRYPEAEILFKRAMEIDKKILGANHPSTAISIDNLATLYRIQGKYSEAEQLLKRALQIFQDVLGPDHLDTGVCLDNLASFYSLQRKYREAEPLFERSQSISEKVLGSDHPSTATSMNNLANIYQQQGKYSKAEEIYNGL